jgi:hypothetical protein
VGRRCSRPNAPGALRWSPREPATSSGAPARFA